MHGSRRATPLPRTPHHPLLHQGRRAQGVLRWTPPPQRAPGPQPRTLGVRGGGGGGRDALEGGEVPDMPLASDRETDSQQQPARYQGTLSNIRPRHHQNSVTTCHAECVAQ